MTARSKRIKPRTGKPSRRWRVTGVIGLVLAGVTTGVLWQGGKLWSQEHTNRLGKELSPYLLLHAHNPVDWYPWGAEALERAKKEKKLIFLSIGYSTCYWCHVMERTVFSNAGIAALMNKYFISIKVDREERPDLDEVYMMATQLMTGGGGWPNSVFLTPDLKPFYAGTYFPPVDMPGRPGFPKVLRAMNDAWTNRPSEVLSHAEAVTEAIRSIQEGVSKRDTVTVDRPLIDQAVKQLKERYDAKNAGFGGAPKFPPSLELELLLTRYRRTRDAQTLSMVTHTLDAMMRGGMYDQIGGGFHRYATDARWRIPHFEKMLYNQAELTRVYLLAYQVTRNEAYRRVAEDVLRYVSRDMLGPDGAFYSAMDSETDAAEGVYYLWTEQEIRKALGDDADLFLKVYALAPMSEGDGRVVYLAHPIDEVASGMQTTPERLRGRLADLKARLLKVRVQRKRPLVDTKVITAWNGMMIDAYAYAYEVTGNARYRKTAATAATFLLTHLRDEHGALKRVYRNGRVKDDAYQEDYAFLVRGLLRLHQATGETKWLTDAQQAIDRMQETFWDEEHGGFFFTDGREKLVVRTKNPYDVTIPSGNSVAAHDLLELARQTGDREYFDTAQATFRAFSGQIKAMPGRFTHMLLAVDTSLSADWTKTLRVGRRATRPDMRLAASGSGADILPLQPLNRKAPAADRTVVHAALSLSKPHPEAGQPFEAVIRLRMEPGWHVNANPASTPDLIPTNVTFNADVPIEVVAVGYPAGTSKVFPFSDAPLSVYRDAVEIRATLRIKSGARPEPSSRLRAILTYQACSDAICLAPKEAQLSVVLK